jgi:hypothetical protein
MLCRLYREPYASTFTLSLMSLIYYCVDEGSTFDWVDLLSTTLTESITAVKEARPRTFPYFHMASFLLDIMCVAHQYLKMGWAWQLTDPSIHIYCKVLWEHKYRTKYHKICEHFFAPLYEFIFVHQPHV